MALFFKNKISYTALVFLFICIGFIVRLIYLGEVPGNGALNYDEAYGGYEAWSMLHYGHDSRGYKNFPVYLKTWGSGMSLLPNLSMMPFIKFLDLTPLAIRLPQAILGCISLVVFFLLVLKIKGLFEGLVALFLLSICPWHIMMSRWGLDCNFFPGFLLISIYLLVKSKENKNYFYLSMIFFGLTLYTYAAPWTIMPFLVMHLLYFVVLKGNIINIFKKEVFLKLLFGFFILFIISLPLMLLVLVNLDYLDEFSFGIFSIPRLNCFRYRDVNFSFNVVLRRILVFLHIIIFKQSDGLFFNSLDNIGIYYRITSFFFIIGFYTEFKKYLKRKILGIKNPLSHIMLIWLFYAFVLSLLIDIHVNRLNIVHLPIIYFSAVGICVFLNSIREKNIKEKNIKKSRTQAFKIANIAIVFLYLSLFSNFVKFYFTEHSDIFYHFFFGEMPKVLEKVKDLTKDNSHALIHTDTSYFAYPNILFYLKFPTDEYLKTVKFVDVRIPVQPIIGFSNFRFSSSVHSTYKKGDIYILENRNSEHRNFIVRNKLKYDIFGRYLLAY